MGIARAEGGIQRDGKMSGIKTHDVKSTKNPLKKIKNNNSCPQGNGYICMFLPLTKEKAR